MRIFSPTSQGSSTFSMTPTVSNVFSLSRSRSATLHRRRWQTRSCTPGPAASSTRAFDVWAERVSRVFGRRSYSTLAAADATRSQSLLKETKSGSGKSRHNPMTDLSRHFQSVLDEGRHVHSPAGLANRFPKAAGLARSVAPSLMICCSTVVIGIKDRTIECDSF